MARCVTFAGTQSMGDRGSKKAYTGSRTSIYLLTKFGCDRLIVVGCKSRNDQQTDRQTDKQNGMTIRLTLCERDATIRRHGVVIVSVSMVLSRQWACTQCYGRETTPLPQPAVISSAFTLVPSYTAGWQRHMGVNNMSRLLPDDMVAEVWTNDLWVGRQMPYRWTLEPSCSSHPTQKRSFLRRSSKPPKLLVLNYSTESSNTKIT